MYKRFTTKNYDALFIVFSILYWRILFTRDCTKHLCRLNIEFLTLLPCKQHDHIMCIVIWSVEQAINCYVYGAGFWYINVAFSPAVHQMIYIHITPSDRDLRLVQRSINYYYISIRSWDFWIYHIQNLKPGSCLAINFQVHV